MSEYNGFDSTILLCYIIISMCDFKILEHLGSLADL